MADFIRDPERFSSAAEGVRRGFEASADDTSANQRGERAFHVQKIFGGFRRK